MTQSVTGRCLRFETPSLRPSGPFSDGSHVRMTHTSPTWPVVLPRHDARPGPSGPLMDQLPQIVVGSQLVDGLAPQLARDKKTCQETA